MMPRSGLNDLSILCSTSATSASRPTSAVTTSTRAPRSSRAASITVASGAGRRRPVNTKSAAFSYHCEIGRDGVTAERVHYHVHAAAVRKFVKLVFEIRVPGIHHMENSLRSQEIPLGRTGRSKHFGTQPPAELDRCLS